MARKMLRYRGLIVLSLSLNALFAWPVTYEAQGNRATFSGQATAVEGAVFGFPVLRADTGSLPSSGGAREDTLLLTNVPGRFGAEVLHASTIGQGNQSRSEATIADVALPGNVFVEFIGAWATAACSPGRPSVSARSEISGMTINGQSVAVSGQPNQTIIIPGGRVVINEQMSSSNNQTGDITVNALHIIMGDNTDLVICSAHAGITCRGNPGRGRGDFVTGGGWIRGPSGAKANFSAAGGLDDGNLWGHLTYNDHGPNGPKVSGTRVTRYIIINSTTRHIEGLAEINGQGGFTYQVDVTDNGEPGRNDIFTLRLSNGYTASNSLGGGNIQVHQP